MRNWIDFTSKKYVAIIAFIVFLLFTAIVLPYVSNYTSEVIGVNESPDTSFIFNTNDFYEMIDNYGEDGRATYITLRWTFDVIWPFVYGFFLLSSIGYLSLRIRHRKYYVYLAILPILFDFSENIIATIIMAIYPKRSNILHPLLLVFSSLKWSALSFAFIVIILLFSYNMIKLIKDYKEKKKNSII